MNMSRGFGWSLPPGVRLSDPGGPEDPEMMRWEAAMEAITDALYQATMSGISVEDINRAWADAAEDAHWQMGEDAKQEEEMYRRLEDEEREREEGEESHGR